MTENESTTSGRAEGDASACAASNNYRITVTTTDGQGQPWGTVTVSRGPVRPGDLAAVRTPSGLTLKKIYYYREGGREFVRLESLLPDIVALRYPLADVTIEGAVICMVKVGERCDECDAAQRCERQKSARARKGRERGARREVDALDWPEYIDTEGGMA